jgi:hypothetical protein
MGYKILGFIVWKAVRFYVSKRVPTRRLAAAGFVIVALVALAAGGAAKRASDD